MQSKNYITRFEMKMFYIFTVSIFALLGILGLANFSQAETRIDIMDIYEEEVITFTRENNPYIIKTGVYVHSGGELKINEGVVIKFERDALIDIGYGGKLEITGDDSEFYRVILTSYNDKNVYTEFSGPDDPQPADWSGIYFDRASKGDIKGAYITYGDAMMPPDYDPGPDPMPGDDFEPTHQGVITVYYNAEVDVYDTIITNNYGGILNYGKLKIGNSEIYNNSEYGVWNQNNQSKVEAQNIWWGFNSGPRHQTLNPEGQGNRVNSQVTFDPWELRNPPVIIIPGAMGSWQNWKGEWVVDPIFHTYRNLHKGFKQQGYIEDENLFTFPYNWRNSNVESAKLLKDKIKEAKQKGKSPKVDLVAHSMGGIVSRQYIESDEYENDVEHLITLGTPHKGATDSFLIWEGGILKEQIVNMFPFNVPGQFKKIYFFSESWSKRKGSLVEYIHEYVPSVKELLPVYDYLRDAQTFDLRPYPENYPANEFLENLNSDSNLKKIQENLNLKFANFVGITEKNQTIDIIRVVDIPEDLKDQLGLLWPHGYPENLNDLLGDHGLELGKGDGTVPFASVNSIGELKVVSLDHHQLATKNFKEIFLQLTGAYPKPVGEFPDFKRLLFFRLFSPIDFKIVDPQGRTMGKDFNSNQEINEIPDAFYSGFTTDLEFITIPDPINGEYKIIVEGVGDGEYEIKVSSIDENRENVEEKSYQGQVEVGDNLNFKVEYNQSKSEALTPIVNTDENYTVRELMNKISEYHRNGAIKDVYVKNYLKHLIRGVQIGEKRIIQVRSQLDGVEDKLSKPDLKPKRKQELEYLKWLYEKRIEFHQGIIRKNLNKFIEKINQYQPNIIEPEAESNLIKMAQNILARYQ